MLYMLFEINFQKDASSSSHCKVLAIPTMPWRTWRCSCVPQPCEVRTPSLHQNILQTLYLLRCHESLCAFLNMKEDINHTRINCKAVMQMSHLKLLYHPFPLHYHLYYLRLSDYRRLFVGLMRRAQVMEGLACFLNYTFFFISNSIFRVRAKVAKGMIHFQG